MMTLPHSSVATILSFGFLTQDSETNAGVTQNPKDKLFKVFLLPSLGYTKAIRS